MKTILKNILVPVLVWILFGPGIHAQNDCNTIILSTPHNGFQSYEYIAGKKIGMIPAFSYMPDPGNALYAQIHPDLLCPVNYDPGTVDPDTRPLDYSLAVGTTQGVFSQGASGSANYSIPIIVAPGTAGLKPDVSLVYNSLAGNGIMGVGWSIAAASSIMRLPRNPYSTQTVYNNVITRGYCKAVTLAEDDFALDGNRLYAMNGLPYGGEMCEYYTEEFNGTKIISHGMTYINEPEWFEVRTKDGKTIEYGRTPDSRITSATSDTVLYWNINKITDLKDNSIEFNYIVHRPPASPDIQFYLSEIKYTSNPTMGLAAYNSVKFTYGTRQDESLSYLAGSKFKSSILLTKIVSYAGNNIVRRYDLNYTFDFNSRLYEIKEFGSDGLRYNSTMFKYAPRQTSTSFKELLGSGGIRDVQDSGYWYHVMDANGDGKSDILQCRYWKHGAYARYYAWRVYKNISADNQFDGVSDLQSIHQEYMTLGADKIASGDANGDGFDDVFVVRKEDGNFNVGKYDLVCFYYRPDLNGFEEEIVGEIPGIRHIVGLSPVEVNGDGKIDLEMVSLRENGNYDTYLLISNEQSTPSVTRYDSKLISGAYAATADKINFGDINGDGKSELLIQDNNENKLKIYGFNDQTQNVDLLFTTTQINKYDSIAVANFNGDSYADLLVYKAYSADWHIYYSNGRGFVDEGTSPAGLTADPHSNDNNFLIGDYNGDGLSDIYQAISNSSNTNTDITVFYSNGKGFVTGTANIGEHLAYWEEHYSCGDFNGDGNMDVLSYNYPNPQNTLQERHLKAVIFNEKIRPNQMVTIADGLNYLTKMEYHPLTNDSYYERSTNLLGFQNSFGQVSECQPPLWVLTKASASSGLGNGLVSTEYSYGGAHFHRLGKGFLGFNKMTQHDIETDMISERTFRVYFEVASDKNEFCTTALVESKVLAGTQLVLDVNYTNQYKLNIYPYDHHCRVYIPFASSTVSDNLLTGVSTTTTINAGDVDNYGNVAKSKISYGSEGYKEILSTYTNVNGVIYWYPSQPHEVTTTLKRPDDAAYSRKVHYVYYGEDNGGGVIHGANPDNIGLLRSIIQDPGKPKMLITLFEYDGFGNISKRTLNTSGISDRITNYTYDPKGRYPIKVKNGLDQSATTSYDERTGNQVTATDPNGLTTVFQYDGFGRQKKIIKPGNISSRIDVFWVTDNQPTDAVFRMETNEDGSPVAMTYHDRRSRTIRSLHGTFGAQNVVVDSKYNMKGQLEEKTEPYQEGGASAGTTTFTYDTYGRFDKIFHPGFTDEYVFTGNGCMITNQNTGQFTWTMKDSWDQVSSVMDPAGTISYTYYSSNLPKTITGVDQAVTTFLYDDYGRQIFMKDPDAGEHHYEYDAYGAIKWEQDPKGNRFDYTYDILGRLKTKASNDNITISYLYDNAQNGIGLLSSVSHSNGTGYQEFYDNLSRIKRHTETVDGTEYSTAYDYDGYGHISKVTYPSGLEVRNEYSKGYLDKVFLNGSTHPIFTTQDFNERGQITAYRLGDGLNVNREYDNFGFPTRIRAGSIYDQVYAFDPATGNMTIRSDNLRGMTESFGYSDALMNRLTEYTVNTQGWTNTVIYNPNGTIDTKSDIGATYQYDPVAGPPHAVSRVNSYMGPHTNENLQSITYTSFNKIEHISHQSNGYDLLFTYGPDFSRVKTELYQSGELVKTKLFIGGGYEVEKTPGGQTRELHYISGADGLAAVYVIENGQGTLYYILKDHLGSWESAVNESGNVVEEMSFDPWGRHRNPEDWTFNGLPERYLFDRGFTGHEHLAEFGLINMNGRVYDPFIAQFLSPDLFVQNASNSQNFNRYAYCLNNPLKYTDPNGEFIQYIIGAILGGINGYMIADANGVKGWDKVWYTLGGAVIGAATAGVGTAVTSSAGMVAGGVVAGAVGGSCFSMMNGYAAGLKGSDIITAGFTGLWQGAITGFVGGAAAGAIGGGFGALVGGAASNLTGQLLANDFSFNNVNWLSVGLNGATSIGLYHLTSYVNWSREAKNCDLNGRSIKYNQYLKMQESYTRGKFWGSEKAGGGFWLTKNGISKQGVSYDATAGNVVEFDFSQKPKDAWATFHPHPYNEGRVVDGNLWNSGADLQNVNNTMFSSMVINKYGAELAMPTFITRIDFWPLGKPYFLFPTY